MTITSMFGQPYQLCGIGCFHMWLPVNPDVKVVNPISQHLEDTNQVVGQQGLTKSSLSGLSS